MGRNLVVSSDDRGSIPSGKDREPVARGSRARLFVIGGAVLGLVVLSFVVDIGGALGRVLEWIEGLGMVGAAVFVGLYVGACVLLLPGSVLTLGAGAIYGVAQGTVLVSVASTLGATVAFLVGRYAARDWVGRKIEGNSQFKAIDEAVAKEGWKIVGLTRLSPVFPFNLLNYAFGLTRVSLRDYFFASWIGMLPGTVMYVYVGSLAGSLATVGTDGHGRSTAQWVLYGVGLAATLLVTVLVTRIARRALRRHVEQEVVD